MQRIEQVLVEFPIMYVNSTCIDWEKGGYFSPGEDVPHITLRRPDFFVLYTDDLLHNNLNGFRK